MMKSQLTHLLFVANYSGFKSTLLILEKSSSIGAALYECGESSIIGTLRFFSYLKVASD